MKKTFDNVDVKQSSVEMECLDGKERKVSYFIDAKGKVWLSADDLGMGTMGTPNTCGRCIRWDTCKIKDRDTCPGDYGGGSEYDPNVPKEEVHKSFMDYCKHSIEQFEQMGLKKK